MWSCATACRSPRSSFDFFDSLKSRTRGYASLDYHEDGEQLADLVKVDILLQGEAVDAFSAIVHKDYASTYGNMMTKKLRTPSPDSSSRCPFRLQWDPALLPARY
ncbi:MAG: hypothetical protein U1U88_002215 [Lawsonella clevelandensis]